MRSIAILLTGLLAIVGLAPMVYAAVWADGPGADPSAAKYVLVGDHGGHHAGHSAWHGGQVLSGGHGWKNWNHGWKGWNRVSTKPYHESKGWKGYSGYGYRGSSHWDQDGAYARRAYRGLRYYGAPSYGYEAAPPIYDVAPAPGYAPPCPAYVEPGPPAYSYGGRGFHIGLDLNINR
jgi:hypothetical protein